MGTDVEEPAAARDESLWLLADLRDLEDCAMVSSW